MQEEKKGEELKDSKTGAGRGRQFWTGGNHGVRLAVPNYTEQEQRVYLGGKPGVAPGIAHQKKVGTRCAKTGKCFGVLAAGSMFSSWWS